MGVEGSRVACDITVGSYTYPSTVAEDGGYPFKTIPAQRRPCLLRTKKEDDSSRVQLMHSERSPPSRSRQSGSGADVRTDGRLHRPVAAANALRRSRHTFPFCWPPTRLLPAIRTCFLHRQ